MKFWFMLMLLATNMAHADTTVYETNDDGVPTFTNVPQPDVKSAKKIVIPDAPVPNQTTTSTTTKASQQQTNTIEKQLQAVDSTEQQLKSQVDMAGANVSQAQQNLDKARKAMADGTYRVGNDQYIDQDYIHNLEEMLANAKQQHAVTQQAYDNYRNQHK